VLFPNDAAWGKTKDFCMCRTAEAQHHNGSGRGPQDNTVVTVFKTRPPRSSNGGPVATAPANQQTKYKTSKPADSIQW